MSITFPHPFHESQPEVRIETFEDLTTARRAVGEVRGFDDPITTELRDDTQNALSREDFQFQPKSYVGDEAKTIVRALNVVAKSREDELAISAADALKRMPKRLRVATFVSNILKPAAPKSTDAPRVAGYPLFDPTTTEKRSEIVWKSKYDKSDQETEVHKLV